VSVPGAVRRVAVALAVPAAVPTLLAGGETNLQQTNDLLWLLIGISVAGAIITFAFLAYSVVKFRDPNNRRRRYG